MSDLDADSVPHALRPGLALLRHGQLESARRFFQTATASGAWQAWHFLGVVQHALGQLEPAAESFRAASAGAPGVPDPRNARATVLSALGRMGEAEQELRQAIASAPAHAPSLLNLAILADMQGRPDEAAMLYDAVIELDPSGFAARLNRGMLRLSRGEATAALQDFDCLTAGPQVPAAVHTNRARALFALHRDRDALAAAREALALEPDNARARLDAAHALASLGQLEECARVIRQGPHPFLDPLGLYLARALERQGACDWSDRDRLCETLRQVAKEGRAGVLLQPIMLTDCLGLPLEPGEIRMLADSIAGALRARSAGTSASATTPAAPAAGRIRVGVLSPEYRIHTGGFVLRRLFLHGNRDRFEYFAYALNPDDDSPVRRELQQLADLFIDVSSWSAAEIAARIQRDGIDLLLDRTGYFAGARPEVLALKPAPLVASYLGQPSTLGAGMADYRVSDVWTTPAETQSDWPERLVLLPAAHAVFEAEHVAPKGGTRSEYDLLEDAVVLCHFDQPHKIEPVVFAVWMRVLAKAPGAILWLLDGGEVARANLRREAALRDVDPERLRFAPARPYEAHLACLAHADLYLNPFLYSSRSIAFNALRAGVPVLMCPGRTMASRLALPFLRDLGLDELLADSPREYEERAIELACDRDALGRMKNKLREASGHAATFDAAEKVRGLERALAAIVERQRSGGAPETLLLH
jgi:protein O-GlcNAc transferase